MSQQIHHHLTANHDLKKKDILIHNFLGGIAWGLGTVIGATFIFAILIYLLKLLGIFNFLTQFTPPAK
jgi:hypothetical protein